MFSQKTAQNKKQNNIYQTEKKEQYLCTIFDRLHIIRRHNVCVTN